MNNPIRKLPKTALCLPAVHRGFDTGPTVGKLARAVRYEGKVWYPGDFDIPQQRAGKRNELPEQALAFEHEK